MKNEVECSGSGIWPGTFPEEGVPVVAGVVIETLPGRAPRAAARLAKIDGLELVGGDGDRRLAGVWSTASGKLLLESVEQLIQEDEELVGVFPTFVGRADEAPWEEVGGLARRAAEDAG